jgi:hypothetical protein
MTGAKLEKTKQAAMQLVDCLAPNDVFSLVIFSDEARVLVPAQKVEDKELGEMLTVAAREIKIEITCPDGVQPLGFIGRSEKFENRKASACLCREWRRPGSHCAGDRDPAHGRELSSQTF